MSTKVRHTFKDEGFRVDVIRFSDKPDALIFIDQTDEDGETETLNLTRIAAEKLLVTLDVLLSNTNEEIANGEEVR